MSDPLPLSGRQLRALVLAAAHQLTWGLRTVSSELRGWRRRARMIPDGPIREDALRALERKRTHITGAALFSILPGGRDLQLLRALVAYEIILEFLDDAHERAAHHLNGLQLHRALVEALDPFAPISDYYLHHPWSDDGGYLRALVEACRQSCANLPFYEDVRRPLLEGAYRCRGVQSLNHVADAELRSSALRDFSLCAFPDARETHWWELTAAASSSLGVHALLAHAAFGRHGSARVHAAYVPWMCTVSTMLDSYVDYVSDLASGEHSYIGYYSSREHAVGRLSELIAHSAREARRLPGGHRHAVIAACMFAMYLSHDRVREPNMRASTDRLAAAGGSLTLLLLPVLRLWRIAYAQRGV